MRGPTKLACVQKGHYRIGGKEDGGAKVSRQLKDVDQG